MKNFGLKVFLCVMITSIPGIAMLYFTFNGFNYTWNGFMTIFAKNSFSVISSAIMICIALFLIISYIIIKLSPSRSVVAKLVEIKQNIRTDGLNTLSLLVFRGEDNKKYAYDINDTIGYETNKNYRIEVKGSMLISAVISVIGETQDACEPKPEKVKSGYWSRLYLPGEKDIKGVTLPKLYAGVILFPLFLKNKWGEGYFYPVIFFAVLVAIYSILYDFYQKIKRR